MGQILVRGVAIGLRAESRCVGCGAFGRQAGWWIMTAATAGFAGALVGQVQALEHTPRHTPCVALVRPMRHEVPMATPARPQGSSPGTRDDGVGSRSPTGPDSAAQH